jgi:prepilin-type N-terminal cleavage/methylation domain-containing protein
MTLTSRDAPPLAKSRAGFTLVEVLFSVVVVGVLVMALYGALASSISMVRSCQENERVTQILSDKLDTIRLYNWEQITNGFVPRDFVVNLDPLVTNSPAYYTGRIAIIRAPISEHYRSNLLEVTVSVNWVSGNRPQNRSMTTYVAKYGLQSYIMR